MVSPSDFSPLQHQLLDLRLAMLFICWALLYYPAFMIHSAPEYWLNDLWASGGNKSQQRENRRCCFKVVWCFRGRWTAAQCGEQRTKIAWSAKAFERCIRAKKSDYTQREETDMCWWWSHRLLKGCLHVQHVINRAKDEIAGILFITSGLFLLPSPKVFKLL